MLNAYVAHFLPWIKRICLHAQARTLSLSLSLSLSLMLSLSFTHTHTHTHTHIHARAHARTHTHARTHVRAHTHTDNTGSPSGLETCMSKINVDRRNVSECGCQNIFLNRNDIVSMVTTNTDKSDSAGTLLKLNTTSK